MQVSFRFFKLFCDILRSASKSISSDDGGRLYSSFSSKWLVFESKYKKFSLNHFLLKPVELKTCNLWVCSFETIQKRMSDLRPLGSWCIKGASESLLRVDSPVPLMHHDLNDLGSLILLWNVPNNAPHAISLSSNVGKGYLLINFTWFLHFLRPKIQGFKDHDPTLKFQGLFFCKNFTSNQAQRSLTRRLSNERALGMKNQHFHTFCKHRELFALFSWTFIFTGFYLL